MSYEIKIAPSLLAADFARLADQIAELEATGVTMLHIDIMDGHFVPNLTMGPMVVAALRKVTQLTFDVHLMLSDPGQFIQQFADAGADQITVHLEAGANVYRNLQLITQSGCKVGLAINPHTPAAMAAEVLPIVDTINVMTVNPGFGGQSFIYETTSKIAELRAMANKIQAPDMDIEVDGGINAQTAPYAIQAGANVLIAGTAIFGHEDGITAGVNDLQAIIDGKDSE